MGKCTLVSVAVLGMASIGWGVPAKQRSYAPSCRHDKNATQEDRDRRGQALVLAKAINVGQAQQVRRTRQYQPLSSLGDLPPVPNGFDLNLYADGSGYIFSVKDTLDPCRFAVFSDQVGLLYEKSGLDAPVVAQ
jgi:hypothetical protein